jgi:hypothetical protein
MEFTPVTAETVSQMIGDCFPIEREVDLATFTHPTTFRTKSLQATIYGHWDGENYQFDGVTYTVTAEGGPQEDFEDRAIAIGVYNALDLSEPLPEE